MTEDRSLSDAKAGRPAARSARPSGSRPRAADEAPTETLSTANSGSSGSSRQPRPGVGPRGAAAPAPGRLPRSEPRTGTPAPAARPAARRRARLAISRVDPWSVFVISLLLSLFLGVVLLVAVGVLYRLLDSLGVLDSVNKFAGELEIIDPGQTVVGLGQVLGIAAVVAAVDVVLLTVLATLGAFLYNVCASLTGGVEVVLAERD